MRKTVLLFVTSFACVASQFDCNVGCSLDAGLMGSPVCGEDTLTYANACLAFCQGVKQYSAGSCGGENDREEEPTSDTEVITLAVMNRFTLENFRFIAKQDDFSSNAIREEIIHNANIFAPRETSRNSVRITREGYKFIANENTALPIQGPTQSFRGYVQDNNNNKSHLRKMAILGEDTRTIVADTTVFPYRTMGAADFTWGDSGCSATMISRTSALTAGHCVYDFAAKKPQSMIRFSPGRSFDIGQNDSTAEPFGTWDVDYMTTFQGFMDTGDETYDMAVVTYKPNKRPFLGLLNLYPGDVVGFLGIDRVTGTSTSVDDSRLTTMSITGYPYDFEEGQMVTSGVCPSPPQSVGPNYIYHTCDSMGGMSGAAVLTSNNTVLGVHNGAHRPSSGLINGATVLSDEYYQIIYGWAGLAKQSSQSCQCSKFADKRIRRLFCIARNFGSCIGGSQNTARSGQ